MPPLYIRLESLSLLDLSLVILSSPTEISKPYPCALLISHHSGPRDPRGFFALPLSYHHLSPSLVERAATSYLASCRVTSLWRHLPNYLPAPFDYFDALFLGRGSRCRSPPRKVGVLIVRMGLARCWKQPYKISKISLLHCKNARHALFFLWLACFTCLDQLCFGPGLMRGAELVDTCNGELHHLMAHLPTCSKESSKWLWHWYCITNACLFLPSGGKRRFEVCEQIPLLPGDWHTGLFCLIQTWWWSPVEECCWASPQTRVKTYAGCCNSGWAVRE